MVDKVLPITQTLSLSHIGSSSKQKQLLVPLGEIIDEMHEQFNGDLPILYAGTIVAKRLWV